MNGNGCAPWIGRTAALAAWLATGIVWLPLSLAPTAAAATPTCANTLQAATPASAASAGGACWTDVSPYPFGSDGNPVDPSTRLCAPTQASGDALSCYLTVTSMTFRAWNRGLAATTTTPAGGTDPFGVWIYNGARWFPDPTFPGNGACKGTTILWAGKLDYWLVGGPSSWPNLCRFDGVNFLWEPLPVPKATLARAPQVPVAPPPNAPPGTPSLGPAAGALTSGACFSYENCWFFGTYGSVVHWDGTALTDASPDRSEGWLATAFTGAVARVDLGGSPFGAAVGTTSSSGVSPGAAAGTPLPPAPDGTPPPELYGSGGGPAGPLPFAAPTPSLPTDPYRTDLVAVDFGSDRQGWVAGNPAGLQATAQEPLGPILRPDPRAGPSLGAPAPAPLLTTTASGANSTCVAPPTDRFQYAAGRPGSADAFLWSSISVVPGSDEALAGGLVWPGKTGPGPDEDGSGEPVIVATGCDGSTTATRFRIADPNPTYGRRYQPPPTAPADRAGTVTAIAANAVNDAWAATSAGGFDLSFNGVDSVFDERPHFYHLTDGQVPAAPAGDDIEPRPLILQLDPPAIPEPPPPAPPTPTPAPTVTATPTRDPPPTVYDVKSTLVHMRGLELYLTFKLRRPVTLGAEALRNGRVVSRAKLRRFAGRSGRLVLALNARRYPTQVRFLTDAPTVTLANPGRFLAGIVGLHATAAPYHGRRIVAVSFEYSPSGKGSWTTIATATAAPWAVPFPVIGLAAGRYDLRAVAIDSAQVSGVSPVVGRLAVAASGRP